MGISFNRFEIDACQIFADDLIIYVPNNALVLFSKLGLLNIKYIMRSWKN